MIRGTLLDHMTHDSEEVSIALSIFFVPSTYLMNPCLPSSTNLMNPCETSPSRPKKEESCCLCRVWKKEKHITYQLKSTTIRLPRSFRRRRTSVRQFLGAASYSTFTKTRPFAELFIMDPNNAGGFSVPTRIH